MSDVEIALSDAISKGFGTPKWMLGKNAGDVCSSVGGKFSALLAYKPKSESVDIAVNLLDPNYHKVLRENLLWEIVTPGILWSVQYKLHGAGKDRHMGVASAQNFTLFIRSESKKHQLASDWYFATINPVILSTGSDRA